LRKILTQSLKIAGFLALGVLLLYLAFKGIAFQELKSTLSGANYWWIGLSLVFLTLGFVLRARRWMLLIQPLGYRPSLKSTYHSLMVGYLSNYALPRLGEVTRCVSLGSKEKIPVDLRFYNFNVHSANFPNAKLSKIHIIDESDSTQTDCYASGVLKAFLPVAYLLQSS